MMPQTHVSRFNALLDYCRSDERHISSAVKNIAMTALCAVFKDIIPAFVLIYGLGSEAFILAICISRISEWYKIAQSFMYVSLSRSYRIRELTDKETSKGLSKELKKLQMYEAALLKHYQEYLQHLHKIVSCLIFALLVESLRTHFCIFGRYPLSFPRLCFPASMIFVASAGKPAWIAISEESIKSEVFVTWPNAIFKR